MTLFSNNNDTVHYGSLHLSAAVSCLVGNLTYHLETDACRFDLHR